MKYLVVFMFTLVLEYYTYPEMQWIDSRLLTGISDEGSCDVKARLVVMEQESDKATVQAFCIEEPDS
jgi:hypothetical protein